jgi:hypothetical protein
MATATAMVTAIAMLPLLPLVLLEAMLSTTFLVAATRELVDILSIQSY